MMDCMQIVANVLDEYQDCYGSISRSSKTSTFHTTGILDDHDSDGDDIASFGTDALYSDQVYGCPIIFIPEREFAVGEMVAWSDLNDLPAGSVVSGAPGVAFVTPGGGLLFTDGETLDAPWSDYRVEWLNTLS